MVLLSRPKLEGIEWVSVNKLLMLELGSSVCLAEGLKGDDMVVVNPGVVGYDVDNVVLV